MPIYEYQCTACGNVTEAWQKFSEEPLTVCPACGGAMCKLISNCAFHLKGSGWYVSDYSGSRPNSATPEAGKESGETTSGTASDSAGGAATAAASKFK
jgi:putative FmdB family regulatory protein